MRFLHTDEFYIRPLFLELTLTLLNLKNGKTNASFFVLCLFAFCTNNTNKIQLFL